MSAGPAIRPERRPICPAETSGSSAWTLITRSARTVRLASAIRSVPLAWSTWVITVRYPPGARQASRRGSSTANHRSRFGATWTIRSATQQRSGFPLILCKSLRGNLLDSRRHGTIIAIRGTQGDAAIWFLSCKPGLGGEGKRRLRTHFFRTAKYEPYRHDPLQPCRGQGACRPEQARDPRAPCRDDRADYQQVQGGGLRREGRGAGERQEHHGAHDAGGRQGLEGQVPGDRRRCPSDAYRARGALRAQVRRGLSAPSALRTRRTSAPWPSWPPQTRRG